MKQKFDTILFDLDGTLVNTYELIIRSFLHTFEKYAPNRFTREDCIPFIGPTLKESFDSVLPEKADEMIDYYREFNIKFHDDWVEEFEGVHETVKKLYENGYKLAVVTTKQKETAYQGLKATNLHTYFSVIIGSDEVEKHKPDPEPLYMALERLDSHPDQSIMVGDSYHDILGAKNAGVTSVGVSWTIKGKDFLKQYEPDFLIDHMTELLKITGVE